MTYELLIDKGIGGFRMGCHRHDWKIRSEDRSQWSHAPPHLKENESKAIRDVSGICYNGRPGATPETAATGPIMKNCQWSFNLNNIGLSKRGNPNGTATARSQVERNL